MRVKKRNDKQELSQEFETTVLDINPEEIKAKLRKLGAKEYPEVLLRRWVYDIAELNHSFIRLRDNGSNITLTYKYRTGTEIGSTQEIEVEVSDFDKTAQMLTKLPFKKILYQENRRQVFRLGEIEFSIDTWPKIPTYLEVESTSKKGVQEGLKLLELVGKDSGDISVTKIFHQHGIDLNSCPVFKF